jgi:DNA invertase Pin-like site-specific DNA recombinase
VVAVWADAGSGVAYDRAGLRALKEAIAARDVDAVIATNAARYARDSGVLADPVAEAQTAHVSLHTIEGPIDPSGIALQRIVNEARRSM